jgi:Tic22-like family
MLTLGMQVYMLKVEGIAFRFLPDPRQIKHALKVILFISPLTVNYVIIL